MYVQELPDRLSLRYTGQVRRHVPANFPDFCVNCRRSDRGPRANAQRSARNGNPGRSAHNRIDAVDTRDSRRNRSLRERFASRARSLIRCDPVWFPIDSITLWLLGGVAQLTDQPTNWRQELLIAIAGPIVSVGLGVVFYALVVVVPASLESAIRT